MVGRGPVLRRRDLSSSTVRKDDECPLAGREESLTLRQGRWCGIPLSVTASPCQLPPGGAKGAAAPVPLNGMFVPSAFGGSKPPPYGGHSEFSIQYSALGSGRLLAGASSRPTVRTVAGAAEWAGGSGGLRGVEGAAPYGGETDPSTRFARSG